VIVCLRTVVVPAEWRQRFLAWIDAGRAIREAHGILAELVLEPSVPGGDTVVITAWPSHEVFDAWIATPERDALTASDVHQAVEYRPSVRYEVADWMHLESGVRVPDIGSANLLDAQRRLDQARLMIGRAVAAGATGSPVERLLADVERFARRKPWMAGAIGTSIGFMASRFLKASSEGRYQSSRQQLPRRPATNELPAAAADRTQ